MGMYAGARALAMMQPGEQPGEHGADQLPAIISHFRWTIVFLGWTPI